jgi:uncharacterized metal-binding protein YceD (DUF177 family)
LNAAVEAHLPDALEMWRQGLFLKPFRPTFASPNLETLDIRAPFRIAFVGLKPGSHHFQMEADTAFFASFPLSEIEEAHVVVDVQLDKIGTTMDCQIHLHGHCKLPCDRCLAPIDVPIDTQDRLVVKMGETTDTEQDVWVFGPEVYQLDLAQTIFEMAHLGLPARRLHADLSNCDPEVVSQVGWTDTDPEGGDDTEDTDPRWNQLKDLK